MSCRRFFLWAGIILAINFVFTTDGLAQSQPQQVRVTANSAAVRAGPGTDQVVLVAIQKGTVLPVSGKNGQWFKVNLSSELGTQAALGFIHESVVENIVPTTAGAVSRGERSEGSLTQVPVVRPDLAIPSTSGNKRQNRSQPTAEPPIQANVSADACSQVELLGVFTTRSSVLQYRPYSTKIRNNGDRAVAVQLGFKPSFMGQAPRTDEQTIIASVSPRGITDVELIVDTRPPKNVRILWCR